MEKFIVTTGKTIDLAVTAALQQLGMDRDSVSVEVLENAKSGFLGIGASPAKVKVTYEVPDEPKKPEAPMSVLSSASRSKPKERPEITSSIISAPARRSSRRSSSLPAASAVRVRSAASRRTPKPRSSRKSPPKSPPAPRSKSARRPRSRKSRAPRARKRPKSSSPSLPRRRNMPPPPRAPWRKRSRSSSPAC